MSIEQQYIGISESRSFKCLPVKPGDKVSQISIKQKKFQFDLILLHYKAAFSQFNTKTLFNGVGLISFFVYWEE